MALDPRRLLQAMLLLLQIQMTAGPHLPAPVLTMRHLRQLVRQPDLVHNEPSYTFAKGTCFQVHD